MDRGGCRAAGAPVVRAAPVVHTSAARDRYGGTDVTLTAQGRSTVVLGRIPADEAEEIARTLRRLVRERCR